MVGIMTNFSSIKNMNIDELAASNLLKCPFGSEACIFCEQFDCDCDLCLKEWLEKENTGGGI